MRSAWGGWVAAIVAVSWLSVTDRTWAEEPFDPQLRVLCQTMQERLIAAGRPDVAEELAKEFARYQREPAYQQEVHRAVAERMQLAKREFAQRYTRLVAAGRRAEADRLLQLFTAYVKGSP